MQQKPRRSTRLLIGQSLTWLCSLDRCVHRYKGRGHWFSPPTVQFLDGTPCVATSEPDQWPSLPPSLEPQATLSGHSWTLRYPSLRQIYDTESRLHSELADYYRTHIRLTIERLMRDEGRRFGALVLEPVCLGAGGMIFVDPLFQACMIQVVRASSDLFGITCHDDLTKVDGASSSEGGDWQGLPVIYDEGLCPLSDLLLFVS